MARTIHRLLGKKRFYLFLFIGFYAFAYNFMNLRMSDRQLAASLNDNPFGLKAQVDYYEGMDRKVRYVEIGHDSLPLIAFIHGAPSSSSFWLSLLKDSVLLSKAKLLAIDRPGYGFSDYGKPELSVENQADILAGLIRTYRKKHDNLIIHGSSYGGTVAARIAMDYPSLADGILLQSASVMPGEEKTYWLSYPTNHWLLRWIVPPSIQVATAEKLAHREQLEAMEPLWDCVTSACIILHGDADDLIYPPNAAYAEAQLVNAAFLVREMLAGSGHDLLWTQRDLLVESLVQLLERKGG